MSNYTRTAQMMIEDRWPHGRLKLEHRQTPTGGWYALAWAYQTNQRHGGDDILALAAGADHGRACSLLLHMIVRPEGELLTTREAAEALGVTDGRVRQFVAEERLTPETPGAAPRQAARFTPEEIHRFLELPRHRGRRTAEES